MILIHHTTRLLPQASGFSIENEGLKQLFCIQALASDVQSELLAVVLL